MIVIEFIPKQGIPFIKFGTLRDEVKQIMKEKYLADEPKKKSAETDCYLDNSLQFSFESDETLSFIEAYAPPPIGIKLLGINAWEISGEELLNRLLQIDKINEKISESGEGPIFVNTIITLWDLDEQYDGINNFKNKKWGAIGIGDERYYNAICNIKY